MNRFSRDVASSQNGKYGYIDHSGYVAIAPQYEHVTSFSQGLAAVRVNKRYFDVALSFADGLALVYSDGKAGYIDRTGTFIWKPTR